MSFIFSIFSKLKRITSEKYIPEIDSLRFFAIFPVIILHFNTSYNRLFTNMFIVNKSVFDEYINVGVWGVELFFAISGFVISSPFLMNYFENSNTYSIKKYYLKRLFRIEPPFIVSLIIIYLINLFLLTYSFSESISHFIATLFYSHYFIYGVWSNINPVTWSLETEIQFYIIFPFIFIFAKKYRISLFVSLLCVLYFISILFPYTEIYNCNLQKSFFPYLHYFIIGILFSIFYINFKNEYFEKKNIIFDIITILIVPAIYFAKVHLNVFCVDLLIFLFFLSIFKLKHLKFIFCSPIISTIGGMCYSIYLLHYSCIYVFLTILKRLNLGYFTCHYGFTFVFTSFFLLIVSSIFYVIFERPFMNNKFIREK